MLAQKLGLGSMQHFDSSQTYPCIEGKQFDQLDDKWLIKGFVGILSYNTVHNMLKYKSIKEYAISKLQLVWGRQQIRATSPGGSLPLPKQRGYKRSVWCNRVSKGRARQGRQVLSEVGGHYAWIQLRELKAESLSRGVMASCLGFEKYHCMLSRAKGSYQTEKQQWYCFSDKRLSSGPDKVLDTGYNFERNFKRTC